MAHSYKTETQLVIEKTGLIPLFYHQDATLCCDVARAVFEAGCPVIEFTNRGEGAMDSFKSIVKFAHSEYPEAVIGVGSVHDPYVASQFLTSGADFVVGPCFNEDVARLCNRHQVLYIPGCATATEIMTAAEVGLDLIKIFPAGALGGPDFIKAIRGPIPWLKAIPTGGVEATEEDLAKWFGANVSAVGLGSNLISKSMLLAKDYKALKQKTAELLATISSLRTNR